MGTLRDPPKPPEEGLLKPPARPPLGRDAPKLGRLTLPPLEGLELGRLTLPPLEEPKLGRRTVLPLDELELGRLIEPLEEGAEGGRRTLPVRVGLARG